MAPILIRLTFLLLPLTTLAFPGMNPNARRNAEDILKRQAFPLPAVPPVLVPSAEEGNSGPYPSLSFNAADQFVDVRPGTAHEYRAPRASDKRGPCPGLNAAANHGFLPRTGIPNIQQTVDGLNAAYSLGPEFSAVLAAIAVTLVGDPIAQTWSIGGPYPGTLPILGGIISNPEGISWSHNSYESDASPARSDAYLNNGDAVSVNVTRFDKLYFRSESYTLDQLRDHNKLVHTDSINNNPYFFVAPFAGLVPPIAHHFIVNLFSNHSADNIQGYLDRNILKQFFGITGPDNAHVWLPGQERIPLNWYKRPSTNPYGAIPAFADVAILAQKYPEIVQVGGNTGTTNSFTGANLGDITGGVFNGATLLEGNNLGCFFLQAAQQGIPDALSGIVSNLGPIIALLNQYISPLTQALNCPALLEFDQSGLYQQFPGAGYSPNP